MLLIYLFAGICLVNTAYCQDLPSQPTDHQNSHQVFQKEENSKENTDKSLWEKIKGEKAKDALLFGMWSIHADGTGEYFGDGRNNVAGMGVFAGAYFGISWKRAGLDIGLIRAGIITANFRIDIDNLKWLGSF